MEKKAETGRFTKIDKAVAAVVAVLVACVCIKAALEVAAQALIPVLVIGAGYGIFRLWQAGALDRFWKGRERKEGGAADGHP